jgi:adenine-specific DNA-methyltransferase
MSTLTDLIRRAKLKDPQLGADLEREFKIVSSRRAFGLNFERHRPEAVELPQRPVRKGDKVRVLPERGSTKRGDQRLWRVTGFAGSGDNRMAKLSLVNGEPPESQEVGVADCVVVAEFRDTIYPGLVSTGSVERGGDKPSHTVINGENFHVLEALTYTHKGKIDCIYIDPPYNTGAKDWKYNNDYVEGDDLYRHSKWLAFMERRLTVAKQLLNPEKSVLIVAIDEKEVHRLALLLEQLFPESDIQTVTTVTNPAGSLRNGRFTRVEEYIFFVFIGDAVVQKWGTRMMDGEELEKAQTLPMVWFTAVRRGGGGALRANRTTPVLFYPVHLDREDGSLHSIGEPYPQGKAIEDYEPPPGTIAMWPLHANGTEQTWRFSSDQMRRRFREGTIRLGRRDPSTGLRSVTYLQPGTLKKIETGELKVMGRADDGSLELALGDDQKSGLVPPAAVWRMKSHFARDYGTGIVKALVPGRSFPFPKSLYAVEDAVRIAVGGKRDAVVLDFFAGSGTTAHAVMRLNKQDGGQRQAICVTNNEVSAEEQNNLRAAGLRQGDPEWERHGICDHITKPRIESAITGNTPTGHLVEGDYKFTDTFQMSDGFEENVEFFTLTYEAPVAVGHNKSFPRIAPLLWLRAGSEGRRIDTIPKAGWDVADVYGVLIDLDTSTDFCNAVKKSKLVRLAYIVTDDERRYQSVIRRLPSHVETVRLYESYLSNFRINLSE